MRKLEDGGEHVAQSEDADTPERQQRPRGVQHGRQYEDPGHEQCLAGQRAQQREAARRRELVAPDAPGNELADVVDEPPLEGEQAVKQPHVQMLETMLPLSRLPGRES